MERNAINLTKDMTFYFEKDKNNIIVDNILFILLEEIFRQLILQRIRIKDSLRIFKDKDKDFWAIWEVYAELNVEFWIYSSIFAFLKTYCIFFHNCWAFWHLLQSFEPFFTLPWWFFLHENCNILLLININSCDQKYLW